jgi:hypothetical protein
MQVDNTAGSPAPEAREQDDDAIWNEFAAAEAGGKTDAPADDDPARADPEPEPDADQQQNADPGPVELQQADAPQDPWATAPPELIAERDRLKAEYEEKFRREASRQTALQRRLAELEAKTKAPAAPKRPAPSPEDLAKVREEYPEVAAPILSALDDVNARLETMTAAQRQQEEAFFAKQHAVFLTKHSDAPQLLRDTDAFTAWVEDQPLRIREAAHRNGARIVDADEAAEVIALYKQHLGMGAKPAEPPAQPAPAPSLSAKRQGQLAATAAPQRTARATVSGIPEDGDPEQIWKAFAAMEARQGT